MNWIVCYKNGEAEVPVGAFGYLVLAEDFIAKCLPPENRDRFYIRKA